MQKQTINTWKITLKMSQQNISSVWMLIICMAGLWVSINRQEVFNLLTEEKINELNLSEYKNDSSKGIILEVDLEYPEKLHNHHNDYPLAAEKIKKN